MVIRIGRRHTRLRTYWRGSKECPPRLRTFHAHTMTRFTERTCIHPKRNKKLVVVDPSAVEPDLTISSGEQAHLRHLLHRVGEVQEEKGLVGRVLPHEVPEIGAVREHAVGVQQAFVRQVPVVQVVEALGRLHVEREEAVTVGAAAPLLLGRLVGVGALRQADAVRAGQRHHLPSRELLLVERRDERGQI
jgi:hypothetical protein